MTQEEIEDYAFYESGLSADGCLERLDNYTRRAIEKYGRILLEECGKRNIKYSTDPMWQKPLGSIPYPTTSNPSYPDITTTKDKIDWQKD